MNNQLNMWYTDQLVTEDQMNDFSEDLYNRIGFFSDAYVGTEGCILNLSSVVQVAGNITLSAGSFRFPVVSLGYLIYTPPLIGNCPGAVVAVSGNGFLVAQYVVTPVTSGAYEYVFTCTYAFVASLLPNMVKIATITAGVIDATGWGTFLTTPTINDNLPAGILTITPELGCTLYAGTSGTPDDQSGFTFIPASRPQMRGDPLTLTHTDPLSTVVTGDFDIVITGTDFTSNLPASGDAPALKIQQQLLTITTALTPQTFTFPVAFDTACLTVMLTPVDSSGTGVINLISFSDTSFDAVGNTSSMDFRYVAIGY